jgi:hypothetical protein
LSGESGKVSAKPGKVSGKPGKVSEKPGKVSGKSGKPENFQKSQEKYRELKLQLFLEQFDVLSLSVELKLQHWPNTAHSFISRLTNKRPVFCHS